MKCYFLAADVPLTKTFTLLPDGQIDKRSYPTVRDFTSFEVAVTTTQELAFYIQAHAGLGHCMLKGQLRRQLKSESRAGSTDPMDLSQWIVFDLDGIDVTDVEDFIHRVLPAEFHDASYVLQWSASAGFSADKQLRCHLFFLMEQTYHPELAKAWLTHLNLNNEVLRKSVTLTASAVALRFPLDRTVVQNDKLIYIAPPTCGEGVADPLNGKRISHVQKSNDKVAFTFPPSLVAATEAQVRATVEELRKELGLAGKSIKYKTLDSAGVVCSNPDVATVTGVRQGRGFIYLNLNGGDSWAYYYSEANPKYLYNFKGEPTYLLSEICPDYWAQINQKQQTVTLQGEAPKLRPFAFRHHATDQLWNGLYDADADHIVALAATSGGKKIADFFIQHGQEAPEVIEDWTYEFQPWNNKVIDFEEKFCNRFERSPYMRAATKEVTRPPSTIYKIIKSIMGDDFTCIEHFMNWLAFIFQTRRKSGTAWVCHGIEGTGKGVFYAHVLVPLFGEKYCVLKQLRDLDDKFNAELEQNLIFVLDEAKLSSQTNSARTLSQIKSLITEPHLSVRAMRANAVQIKNYSNFLFYSNEYDALGISATDRRFNVAPRQENRLFITPADIQAIQDELPEFASYLASYDVDEMKAMTALNNAAKQAMRDASQDALEQLCQAVIDGNLGYFMQYYNAESKMTANMMAFAAYKDALKRWLAEVNRPSIATQSDLEAVFTYLMAPPRPWGAQKFQRIASGNNLVLRDFGEMQLGARVHWRANDMQIALWKKAFDDQAAPSLRNVA